MRGMIIAAAALAVLGAAAGAPAQTVGIKGGWDHATLSGPVSAEGVNAFAGGAFLEIPLGPAFALQGEVLRVPKGDAVTTGGITASERVNYTEVPVLAELQLPLGSPRVKPSLFAGPYFAIKGSCRMETAGSVSSSSIDCGSGAADIASTDLGATFGAGVAFPLSGKVAGLIEARYDLGMKTADASSTPADVKNRAVMVFAGLSLPLGSRWTGTTERER